MSTTRDDQAGTGAQVMEWPILTYAERDRRWRIAQEIMDANGLEALMVYGERDIVGVPHFAPDVWFSNDRPGSVVIMPSGEQPYSLVPAHLYLSDNSEAMRNGDQPWIPPDRMFAGSSAGFPGRGRNGETIAEFLREHRLDGGRIGVIGIDPEAYSGTAWR